MDDGEAIVSGAALSGTVPPQSSVTEGSVNRATDLTGVWGHEGDGLEVTGKLLPWMDIIHADCDLKKLKQHSASATDIIE